MKYKSELLNEILEQRGHEVPNLHYQSECIESWIEENKGAYPKLCDYESEWLNYIYENPIGEFPYETVTTNNTATINNVVPFEYKSAILKGQTMVNLINATFPLTTKTPTDFNGNFEYGKTYTIFFDIETIGTGDNVVGFVNDGGAGGWAGRGAIEKNGKFSLTLTIVAETTNGYTFRIRSNNTVLNSLMILEGDYTNVDIPYFTGMQSVRMPVLTTTGKNLFDENKKIAGYIAGNSINENLQTDIKNTWTTYWIKAKPNTKYIISGGNRCRWQIKSISGVITYKETEIITTLSDTEYIRCYYCSRDYTASNVQIEEGTQITSYEPYKSNILTVNEDVELRGIGDVQDTLDCLTGEMTERIGEIVLDGSEDENWSVGTHTSVIDYYRCSINIYRGKTTDKLICNNFKQSTDTSLKNEKLIFIGGGGPTLFFNIEKSYLPNGTVEELRKYLEENNIVVQYPLKTPVVKTVDLTITNQDGDSLSKIKPIEGTMHIEVSGTPISPTAVLEVPVEAITQNLNSFIEG